MIKFSDNQKLAYSTINQNVCVNAGAGTGKTEVDSERFRYMYEKGIDIPKEMQRIDKFVEELKVNG